MLGWPVGNAELELGLCHPKGSSIDEIQGSLVHSAVWGPLHHRTSSMWLCYVGLSPHTSLSNNWYILWLSRRVRRPSSHDEVATLSRYDTNQWDLGMPFIPGALVWMAVHTQRFIRRDSDRFYFEQMCSGSFHQFDPRFRTDHNLARFGAW